MFVDYHVHTEFSDDSVYPMEEVVRDAIQMGMDEICFTDHVDYGVKNEVCGTDPPDAVSVWGSDRDSDGHGVRYADAYDPAL